MFSRREKQRILIKHRRKLLSFSPFFQRGKKHPGVKTTGARRLNSGPAGGAGALTTDVKPSRRRNAAIDRSGILAWRRKNKNVAPPQSPVLLRCCKFQPRAPPTIYGGAEIVSLHCTVIISRRPFITAHRKPYLS